MAATPIMMVHRGKQDKFRQIKSVYNDLYRPYYGKGQVLFTGPDGIKDHKTKILDPTFIGFADKAQESTDNLSYIWRAAKKTPHPPSKSKMVGEIGWNVTGNLDRKLLASRQQITLGEFRQACEDRYTHRNQSPWYPMRTRPNSEIGWRKQDAEDSSLPADLQQTRIKRSPSRPKTSSTIGSLPRYGIRNRPVSPSSSSSGSFRTSSSLVR